MLADAKHTATNVGRPTIGACCEGGRGDATVAAANTNRASSENRRGALTVLLQLGHDLLLLLLSLQQLLLQQMLRVVVHLLLVLLLLLAQLIRYRTPTGSAACGGLVEKMRGCAVRNSVRLRGRRNNGGVCRKRRTVEGNAFKAPRRRCPPLLLLVVVLLLLLLIKGAVLCHLIRKVRHAAVAGEGAGGGHSPCGRRCMYPSARCCGVRVECAGVVNAIGAEAEEGWRRQMNLFVVSIGEGVALA